MFKIILIAATLLVGFGGGFVAGMKYKEHVLYENPEQALQIYTDKLGKSAKSKFDKVKKALLED